jgi:hypothetical protein
MKNKKYYTVYKTTNLINGKYYIGVHATNKLDDYYLGSGLLLKKAIHKYKKENFKKEILFIFNCYEDAYKKEKELVNEKTINLEECYNFKIGGEGGSGLYGEKNGFYGKKHKPESLITLKNRNQSGKNNPMYGKKHIEESKRIMSESRKGLGKKPKSEETKQKMSLARKYYWENKRLKENVHQFLPE